MIRFLVRFFAVIGFVIVASIGAAVYFSIAHEPTPPERIVLSFDLSAPLAEAPGGGWEEAFNRHPTLNDFLDALEKAEHDPRVKGIIARFGGDVFGYAKAHDLRRAVERFRAGGRFALAYADAFGEGQSGALALSVAAAFDEVWMQPMGMVSANWPALEIPFARDAFESLGISPQFEKREAYKSFADTFTERDLTPAHREMLESLVGGLGDELAVAIARGRNLPVDTVRALMNAAPLSDAQAVSGRLIDRLAYRDEALDEAERRAGPDAELLHPLDYLAMVGPPHVKGSRIALIHAVGEISEGEDGPGLNGLDAHARRLTQAFADAVEDVDVRAILFRIDSPGGSATASETIRRAVNLAKKAGKPVVVSMGDYAASGGYWIAMDADRIIAAPGALTGSIGVVTGKLPLEGAFAKLGIAWRRVAGGPGGNFWSPIQPMSDGERRQMAALTDDIYGAFLRRVSEARHMPLDAVRAVAQGRVWTGAQAKERGLVDELGGRREALAAVRRVAKLPVDAPLHLVSYPAPPSPLEQLLSMLGHDSGFTGMLRSLARLGALAGKLEHWIGLGGGMAGGMLSAAPPVAPAAAMPVIGGLPGAGQR